MHNVTGHFKITSVYTIKNIWFLFFISQLSFGQNLIDKEEAITIALRNGLKTGIEEPQAQLIEKNIWEVKSLLCDDNNKSDYNVIKINANTGEIVSNMGEVMGWIESGYRFFEQTVIKLPRNFDSIPIKVIKNKPYKLTNINEGNESSPVISDNNKMIAFQFGIRKIGIINIKGRGFQEICDECYNPYWIDNNWIAYFKDYHIYKLNINTGEEIRITKKPIYSIEFQISPDFKWIAYTSEEVWPKKDSLGRIIFYSFWNGEGYELCLASINGEDRKFITKTGKYVHTPCWSTTGDSIFFYIENDKHFATNLDNDTITYSPLKGLDSIALEDYKKIVNNIFPYKKDCQVFGIDFKSRQPTSILIEERGRYNNLTLSNNLEYFIYSKKDCKRCDDKIWIFKLE